MGFEPLIAPTEFETRVGALHFFFRFTGRSAAKDNQISMKEALYLAAMHFPDVAIQDVIDDMLSEQGVRFEHSLLYAIDPAAAKCARGKKLRIGAGSSMVA